MPFPFFSEHPLTRSQVRLGKAGRSASPTHESSSPCKPITPGKNESEFKSAPGGRRKVLADLDGNDSPIVGLIPASLPNCARTPYSDLKSAMGNQNCKSNVSEDSVRSGNTPLGESALRSQVQLLLQKVESDNPANKQAPSLRALCHLHNFMVSPALKLLAPTPMNTPCNVNPDLSPNTSEHTSSTAENSAAKLSVEKFTSKDEASGTMVEKLGGRLEEEHVSVFHKNGSGIKFFVDLSANNEAEANAHPRNVQQNTSGAVRITITESVNSGRDHQIMHISPLISETLSKVEGAENVSLGKKTTRILQFDSPDKSSGVASPEQSFSSIVRELDEDEDEEASEWSVLVNVSSPGGRHDEPEISVEESAETSSLLETTCAVKQKIQHGRNKVDLLWSTQRRATPFRRGAISDNDDAGEQCDTFSNSDMGEFTNDGWMGKDEYLECKNIEESFCDLTLEEEDEESSKGLPRGEGKHIRFTYDSDGEEIDEQKPEETCGNALP